MLRCQLANVVHRQHCMRLAGSAIRRSSIVESATRVEDVKQMTPKVPPGARSVVVSGCHGGRFGSGPWQALLKFLRSPRLDVNFDFRSWARHNGMLRNLRLWTPLSIWRSPDYRRTLFPDVAQVGLTAAAVTYYNHLCAELVWKALDTDGDGDVSTQELKAGIEAGLVEAHHIMGTDFFTTGDMILLSTMQPFALTSIALGMMLTFRTQNCNGRYTEARQLWGAMVNESRAVSSRILALVRPADENSEAARAADHAVKCIMTFSHTMKYHVTVDGFCPDIAIRMDMTDAEINASKGVALDKELASVWDYNSPVERAYVERLLATNVPSRPLHVLQELSEINASVFRKPISEGGAGLDPVETTEIFRSVTRFQDVLGACERIYKTPIYSGYTRFTSRCVFVWTNLLPLALYPMLGPMGTVPTSMVIALFLYGLEDVGTRIEEPFDALPLWQYVEGIDGSCKQMLTHHKVLKDLPR